MIATQSNPAPENDTTEAAPQLSLLEGIVGFREDLHKALEEGRDIGNAVDAVHEIMLAAGVVAGFFGIPYYCQIMAGAAAVENASSIPRALKDQLQKLASARAENDDSLLVAALTQNNFFVLAQDEKKAKDLFERVSEDARRYADNLGQ